MPGFGVNTYSYTFDWTAADCLRHLADQGFRDFELMMYPGHLWPTEIDEAGQRDIQQVIADRGLRLVTINMPNVDVNIAGASAEMRDYSLGLLAQFTQLAGALGAHGIIIGTGKANPLFAAPREQLIGHFYRALDQLAPVAAAGGVKLYVENMPFGFLPGAAELMDVLDRYGDPAIRVIYDIANGHFIGEDPCEGLRITRPRLELVHFSDTARSLYRHDPVGMGDVPFAAVRPVLDEIGYTGPLMLEVISREPDRDMTESVAKLAALGYN